jgi:hypothetical protein
MPIDMRRVIRAAVDAALEEPVPQPRRKRRLLRGRTLLVGAGVITAGKVAASSRGREMLGMIRSRVEDLEERFLGPDDESLEDEAELDEQEEPDAEIDEGDDVGDGRDDELDEEEPAPELEEDQEPSRNAPARRGRGRRS